jgi:hypothetical protein
MPSGFGQAPRRPANRLETGKSAAIGRGGCGSFWFITRLLADWRRFEKRLERCSRIRPIDCGAKVVPIYDIKGQLWLYPYDYLSYF